jgi:hypothetical protein
MKERRKGGNRMLGYIRTATPELKVREQEFYRALYCGLCKHMGKCTGQCSRMTLSYDFVFLAAVRMALTGEKVTLTRSRCLLHPFRRKPMAANSPTLSYCAYASALLVYHKLMDDLADERGLKKARALLCRPFLSPAYRRAKKQYPQLDGIIAQHLQSLTRYEKDLAAPPSADVPALYFGELMEAVFAEGLTDTNARIAGAIGRAVGRWIYLVDAADDLAEDRKKNRFNPYLRLFEGEPTPENWETVKLALTALLCDAERAYLLMDSYPAHDLQGILANLLYLGLPQKAEQIIQRNITTERDNH